MPFDVSMISNSRTHNWYKPWCLKEVSEPISYDSNIGNIALSLSTEKIISKNDLSAVTIMCQTILYTFRYIM